MVKAIALIMAASVPGRIGIHSSARETALNVMRGSIQTTRAPLSLAFLTKKALFVPYAGVTLPFDPYTQLVRKHFAQLGYHVESVHETGDPIGAVRDAEAIVVGGGNTFHLLHHLYKNDLVDIIRERVNDGIPYLGWSAGSNVACPTES